MARGVIGGTSLTALLGGLLGCVGVFLGAGALQSLLYGLERSDPISLMGSVVLLVLVAGLASAIPALRATRVAPTEILKAR